MKFAMVAVICGAVVAAHADAYWTTNGVHAGVLTVSSPPGAATALDGPDTAGGHNYVGSFTLSYALWTLGGEPLHEYIFTWDWRAGEFIVAQRDGRTITTGDLAKYPDLNKKFFSLRPSSVILGTRIEFYDAAGHRFALGSKSVQPGLVEAAGVKDPLHVPGSPRWADFFIGDYSDKLPRADLGRRNRELFQKAARVQLSAPKLTLITWPENSLKFITDEFLRREAVESALVRPKEPEAKTNRVAETSVAPSAVPQTPAVTNVAAPPPNPFEQAARAPLNPFELAGQGTRAKSENPLEKKIREEPGRTSEQQKQ